MVSKILTSLFRLLLLGVFFIFIFFPDKFLLEISFPGFPLTDNIYIRLTKTVFWIFFMVEIVRIFYYGIVKSQKKGLAANVWMLVLPVILLLITLEVIFMYIPQSHEGVLSKASQIWWTRYWKPVNTLGYRDREPDTLGRKTNVLVVGDSFAAGHGLEQTSDRFSDQLGQKLGTDRFAVYNLGVSGSDTRDEADRLERYPVKPNVIVLQYFLNDIEKVGREHGLTLSGSEPYSDLKGPMSMIVKRFYLPNFIYWQLPHTGFSTFEKFVSTSYSDSTILNAHLSDLSRIIRYRDSTRAEMYAVMIPFLFQLEKSATYTRPVEEYLRNNGVTVVTLNDEIAKLPEKDRIVGRNDAHGSAKLNALISEKLFNTMKTKDKNIQSQN